MVEMTLTIDAELKHNETPNEALEAVIEAVGGDPDYEVTHAEVPAQEAGAE